jgi:hypothetical protein
MFYGKSTVFPPFFAKTPTSYAGFPGLSKTPSSYAGKPGMAIAPGGGANKFGVGSEGAYFKFPFPPTVTG